MKTLLILFLITALYASGVYTLTHLPEEEPVVAVGTVPRAFNSQQLAANPVNNYILSTDGTNNSWIVNSGGGGGGGGLFTYDSGTDTITPIIAPTSNTARLSVSSFHATSTATSSTFNSIDFTYASGTAITVTNLWGTASLATALAANGANCSAGNAPLGVDASGAVEGCFDVWTEAENTAAAYLTGNQTITLSGDVTGSGATSITTSLGANTVADNEIDYTAVTLSDFTNDANYFDTAGTNLNSSGSTVNLDDTISLSGVSTTVSTTTRQVVLGTGTTTLQTDTIDAFRFLEDGGSGFELNLVDNTLAIFRGIGSLLGFKFEGDVNITGTATATTMALVNPLTVANGGTGTTTEYYINESSTIFGSSTLALDGSYSGSGTTTYARLANYKYPVALTSLYCKTDQGTVDVQIGNGTASSTVTCTTSGAESTTIVPFTSRANYSISIGMQSSDPNFITVTDTRRHTIE